MTLKIVCAWCGRILGTKDCECPGGTKTPVSHGICNSCKEKVLADMDALPANTPHNINDN